MDDLDYLRLGLGDSYFESGRVFRRTRAREHFIARDPSMPRLLPLYSKEAVQVLEAAGRSMISSATRSEDMPGLYPIVESMPGLYPLVESEEENELVVVETDSDDMIVESEEEGAESKEESAESEESVESEEESKLVESEEESKESKEESEESEEESRIVEPEENKHMEPEENEPVVVEIDSGDEIVDCVSDSSSIESIGVETTNSSTNERNSDGGGIANSE